MELRSKTSTEAADGWRPRPLESKWHEKRTYGQPLIAIVNSFTHLCRVMCICMKSDKK